MAPVSRNLKSRPVFLKMRICKNLPGVLVKNIPPPEIPNHSGWCGATRYCRLNKMPKVLFGAKWRQQPQIAERLLQRGSGARSIYKVLVKGEFNILPLITHLTKDFLLVRRIKCHHEGI